MLRLSLLLLMSFLEVSAFSVRESTSRRVFAQTTISTLVSGLGISPAQAAKAPELDDKQKIKKGYERLNYLLDNWVKETTVCGKGEDNPYLTGAGCDRTPLKVMEYLGYRSTQDPLFKAEKTLRRLEPLVPADRESEFLEAVEKFNEVADDANGLAFVSSWGEANPGGGKDRVELFIERAKNDVIRARDSLGVVIDILQL